ncbi:MAG: FAD-dependent oxidoreductase [Armatimonadia bacterium]
MIRLEAREIPVLVETDVLVCGGGPGGTAAALAAARAGARVTMIERYNHLGGLATGGLVLVLPHFIDNGRQTIGGLGLEMRDKMVEVGEAWFRERDGDSSYFEPEALKWISLKLCKEAGVNIIHHAWISDAITEDGRIRGVVCQSKAGAFAAMGKIIVDATGDGDIYAWAGAEFDKTDQAIGLPFRVGGLDIKRWMDWVKDHGEESRQVWEDTRVASGWPEAVFSISAMSEARGTGWGNNFYRVDDGLNPVVLSEIEVNGRLAIWEAIQMFKKRLPGWENAWLIDTACQLGVRRSRRLKGMYQLQESETSQVDFRHPDAIGRGNDFRKRDLSYDIPYGTLVPEKLDGLLTCGRCISCTHEALEPIREIHVCWVSGEGAGLAAAMAIEKDIQPRDVSVPELQSRLLAANVAFAQDYPG